MPITDELANEILEDIRLQKTASEEIAEIVYKHDITEKELLIILWLHLKTKTK
jgi:hypothetical protein